MCTYMYSISTLKEPKGPYFLNSSISITPSKWVTCVQSLQTETDWITVDRSGSTRLLGLGEWTILGVKHANRWTTGQIRTQPNKDNSVSKNENQIETDKQKANYFLRVIPTSWQITWRVFWRSILHSIWSSVWHLI